MAEQMFAIWKITTFTKLRETRKKSETFRNVIARKFVRFRVLPKQPRKKNETRRRPRIVKILTRVCILVVKTNTFSPDNGRVRILRRILRF